MDLLKINDMQQNALPSDYSSLVSEQTKGERKKKGLCIICGEVNTHVKTWFGGLAVVDSDSCFKERMCRACHNKKFGRRSLPNFKPTTTVDNCNCPSVAYDSRPSLAGLSTSDRSRRNNDSDPSIAYGKGATSLRHSSGDAAAGRPSTGSAESRLSNVGPSVLKPLERHLWNCRPVSLGTPRPPQPFPQPILRPGLRDVFNVLVSDWMDISKKRETVYLMKQEKPDFVYRKVDYPPVVELPYNAGTIVFCLRLERHSSGLGFIEPPLRDQQSRLVMIKQFTKKHFHSLCDGESPLKDVSVLQQLGDTSDGILGCLEALEDDRYIYVICKMDRFRTLADCSIRPPATSWLQQGVVSSANKNGSEEDEIKSAFLQLVLAVMHLHQHGVCHRNLNPETMLCNGSVNSSSRYKKYQLSHFHSSLLVPMGSDTRHWIRRQSMTICSKKEYMAPEVYNHPVMDEGTPCFDGLSADMWSLGVSLFELLTGHHLHRTPSHMDIKYCHFIVNGGLTNSEINFELIESLFGDNSACDFYETNVAVESLSADSRQLMADLLREDPALRLTAEEVINHRWLKHWVRTNRRG
jgi:hypothetical protein